MLYTTYDSPIGELVLTGNGRALTGLYMQGGRTAITVRPEWEEDPEPFAAVRAQLDEYFAGERTTFDLPLQMAGSDFQRRVWRALQDIPYGETTSYGEIARRIGRLPTRARWARRTAATRSP